MGKQGFGSRISRRHVYRGALHLPIFHRRFYLVNVQQLLLFQLLLKILSL